MKVTINYSYHELAFHADDLADAMNIVGLAIANGYTAKVEAEKETEEKEKE